MPAVVSLKDIVDAMDLPQEWEAFLDPESGEVVTVSDEDQSALAHPDPESLPEWQHVQRKGSGQSAAIRVRKRTRQRTRRGHVS